jgi:uncharacterized membrane protein YkvA (DUF1232 family)
MGFPAGFHLNGPERVILFGLYEAPLQTRSTMVAHIREYLAAIVAEAEHKEFVDTEQATRLAHALITVIEDLKDDVPDEHRRLVQAAAAYFALTDDVSDDVDSPIGFDDDERVVRAVLRYIGRPELLL